MGTAEDDSLTHRAQTHGLTPGAWVFVVAGLFAAVLPLQAQCPNGNPPPCFPRPDPPRPSVAVLYFDNVSRDTSEAYLAEGLTESLIDRLGHMDGLIVASRYQSRRARTGADPLSAPGVTHVVTGSVRRVGGQLRVSVELVRAPRGERVWGAQYDRAAADLLDVEAQIATEIATQIVGRLMPGQRRVLGRAPTRDAAAYDHYLRGNARLGRRTQGSVEAAVVEYERATRRDRGLVVARAGAAYAYALAVEWRWALFGLSRDSLSVRGLRLARESVRDAPRSSEAALALGYNLRLSGRADSGLAMMARATALDSTNAEAWHQYGSTLVERRGREEEGIRAMGRALMLEPDRLVSRYEIAWQVLYRGRYTEARAGLDTLLRLEPGAAEARDLYAQVLLLEADPVGARREADIALRLGTTSRLRARSVLAGAAAALGDTATARAIADSLSAEIGDDVVGRADRVTRAAAALLAAGERGRAMMVLESEPPSWLWDDPMLAPLRADPRFRRLDAMRRN